MAKLENRQCWALRDNKQLPRLQQQKAQETKYPQSRSGTVWERNYKKISELAKKKEMDRNLAKKALPSWRPTESGQNEKQDHSYTSCQEAKWEP